MKYMNAAFAFLFVFVMLFNAVGMAVDSFAYDMDELPKGEFFFSAPSPDNSKNLSFYLVEIDGVNTAIRGELSYTEAKGETESRNIYWQVGTKTVEANWKDEKMIIINENEIYLDGEPYDSRTQIILPEHSAKNRVMNEE